MSQEKSFQSLEEEVSSAFVQRLHGEWTAADQAALEKRLASDPAYAEAYRLAQETIDVLSIQADGPEMMRFREQALADARLAAANRWLGPHSRHLSRWRWAAALAAAVGLALLWQFSPLGYRSGQYRTGTGEQRVIELDDHSLVALDAETRIAVHYTLQSRTVELLKGQAEFSVAKDPGRPFKVIAGDRTIIDVGTVFTVEYVDRKLQVAIVEGRVAVASDGPPPGLHRINAASEPTAPFPVAGLRTEEPEPIELSAGEALKVTQDGRSVVIPHADLEAATAWRDGKVIFRNAKLSDAVERMNRYSRVKLEIADPALDNERVSGVFEAGDTEGFIKGVQLALPVLVRHESENTALLSLGP